MTRQISPSYSSCSDSGGRRIGCVVRHEAVRRLEEHARILRLGVAAGRGQFGVAVGVVHADAEDFLPARHRRQQFHLGQRKIRPHARDGGLDLVQRAGAQHVENRVQPGRQPRAQIDDAIAGDDAEARPAADVVGGEMHDGSRTMDRASWFARGTIGHCKPPVMSKCPSASPSSARRSMSCARAMWNSAFAISPARAPFTSIAWAIWSAPKSRARSICGRSRSATTIRSCCARARSRPLTRSASSWRARTISTAPPTGSSGATCRPRFPRCRTRAARCAPPMPPACRSISISRWTRASACCSATPPIRAPASSASITSTASRPTCRRATTSTTSSASG